MKNHVLYTLSAMIGFALCGIPLTTITVISMDRFIALQYHLRYATLVTNSRLMYSIVAVWLIILIYSGLRLWDNVLFHLLSAIFTGVYLAISTLCYIKIYQIIRRHRLQIRSKEQATKRHIIQNRIEKMRLKQSAMNTFVFYISMIACYFPSYVLLFLFWNFLFHMENWMDHLDYRCVHELVPESNSLLLAYSPSSGCSCEDGKIYVMHHHWLISKTLTFVRQFWLLSVVTSCV